MLVIPNQIKTQSVERLVMLWGSRYTPDLSSLSNIENTIEFRQRLIESASPNRRHEVTTTLTKRLIAVKCQLASIKANALYSSIPNVVNLNEAKRLSDFAALIYLKLVEVYGQTSALSADEMSVLASALTVDRKGGAFPIWEALPMEVWGMPQIEELAVALEPLLLEFQNQHVLSKNWHTLGFLTTLLNFCNQNLRQSLSRVNQILIDPYFRFVEEQVALPWQRVCLAAAAHPLGSPKFTIVEACLPQSRAIAQTVHYQLIKHLPNHCSDRGTLSDPGMSHSSIRDLQMFQAYFWLCFLSGNMTPLEQELLPLCLMVLTKIDVTWEIVKLSNQLLFDKILARLTPEQVKLVRPYADNWIQIFTAKQTEFQQSSRDRPYPELPAAKREQAEPDNLMRRVAFRQGLSNHLGKRRIS